MKTNHKESRQRQVILRASDLTPEKMNLAIGDTMYVYKETPMDEREIGRKRRVPVKVLKLYRNHALCLVNGRYNEAFTYAELAQAKVRGGEIR